MSGVPNFPGKKISLSVPRIKMLSKVRLYDDKIKKSMNASVKFWPQPEEQPDDGLPKAQ